ncbi:MAG: tripartite tricarboxylate transporter TctB family protein [Deltaproteobacteria bacterium]|nr:tripartite tricarboxylate transporter TctB family protein [Deltaproteobacteria bacterium]
MDEKRLAKADFITSIFLILLSILIMLYTVFSFPRFPEWGGIYSNPGFVPFLLGLSLFLMSLYLLARSLRRQGYPIRISREGLRLFIHSPVVIRFFICFGLFILYYLLLGRIPFIINTALYLFFSIMIFGRGKWYIALIISAATSLAVYLIFIRVFLVPLP